MKFQTANFGIVYRSRSTDAIRIFQNSDFAIMKRVCFVPIVAKNNDEKC